MKKRIISLLVVAVLLAGLLPFAASAISTKELLEKYGIITDDSYQTIIEQREPTIPGSKPADTEPDDPYPPAFDEAFSDVSFKTTSHSGKNTSLVYNGFSRLSEMTDTIEEYIEILEDYGYTLTDSEVVLDTYYNYWLDCSDDSIKSLTMVDQKCQLFIQGFSYYGTYEIYVYYSPSIVGHYASGGSDDSSGGGVTMPTTDPNLPRLKTTCYKCFGDGKVNCSKCNGVGYKEKYVGSGKDASIIKDYCSCNFGKVTCSVCNGSGKY